MNVLVINCGSSSLKFQLIDSSSEEVLAKGICERIGIDGGFTYQPAGKEKENSEKPMPTHKEAISYVLEALTDKEHGVVKSLEEIGAVGHRIVHGGDKFAESVILDDKVIEDIDSISDLAPLHNPANIIGIKACRELMPNTPMVAVFDTAFHQTMPAKAYMYGLPYYMYRDYKVRRYGFHGTSHSFVSKRAAEILGKPYNQVKSIICHLGNGSSVTAVENGKSIDTSMGMTPIEGLIMGTRCGNLDAGAMEYIAKKENLSMEELMKVLNKKSGVFGLSGNLSSDFRDLNAAADSGNEKAKIALDVFSYHVAKYVGAYVAAMNGVDVICFTAGIGENDAYVRQEVSKYFGYLGIKIDSEKNKTRGEEMMISTPDSKLPVYIIPTNEELTIARETVALL